MKNPLARPRSLNFYMLLGLDAGLVLLAHLLAYLTRFEAIIPQLYMDQMLRLMPIIVPVKITCFFYFDLYKGMWRYTSLPDLFNVIKATVISSFIIVVIVVLTERFTGFSRSVFILDWLYTVLLISGIRVGIRMFYGVGMVNLPEVFKTGRGRVKQKAILIGAGGAGEKLVRDSNSPESGISIMAIFDDDPNKHNRLLHGIPIIGPISFLPRWKSIENPKIHEALIAIPTVSGPRLREIVDTCEQAGLPYRRIPSLSEIARGEVSIKDLRDIDYKDLLGREQAHLDLQSITDYLEGATVLVTGAGGSIGSELCRQIIPFKPGKLILLDSGEYNLYSIQMELEHEHGFKNHLTVLGNLQDAKRTSEIVGKNKPDVIFHAAAYKHVPLLELNESQAVYNNVLATENLIRSAVEHEVQRLLVVSTDKAVRPTNVMGASKRLTEIIMQSYCRAGTRLMAVRFGNVIGSAGSVIPLFRRQIEHGGPVTVTHPDVTRYFMTIEEASQLILQAGSMGGDGEIFILRMGQPIKIADMAADLIKLSGKEPGKDIEIRFIGLRPGEKLYEELITEGEDVVPTDHGQIMVLKGSGCITEDLSPIIKELKSAADAGDRKAIRKILREVVPEYSPSTVN